MYIYYVTMTERTAVLETERKRAVFDISGRDTPRLPNNRLVHGERKRNSIPQFPPSTFVFPRFLPGIVILATRERQLAAVQVTAIQFVRKKEKKKRKEEESNRYINLFVSRVPSIFAS